MTLVSVLFMLVGVLTLTAILFFSVFVDLQTSSNVAAGDDALYIAEAGIHHLWSGEPYGFLFPIVPRELRTRASTVTRDRARDRRQAAARPARPAPTTSACRGADGTAGR